MTAIPNPCMCGDPGCPTCYPHSWRQTGDPEDAIGDRTVTATIEVAVFVAQCDAGEAEVKAAQIIAQDIPGTPRVDVLDYTITDISEID